MATSPNTPMSLPPLAQEAVVKYINSAFEMYRSCYPIRDSLMVRDRAYLRTTDTSLAQRRAKAANDAGDPTKLQNIVVPVVMPQVESALADLQEIFLTGYPIFGVVAPPDQLDAMFQMETQIGENSIRAAWPMHLAQAMRDGLKYDLGAVEVCWENRKIFTVATPSEKNLQAGVAKETYYAGNFITRRDPYNLILDSRVSPEVNHISGEFAGYVEVVSRIETKKRMENLSPLGSMNFRKALEAPGPGDNIFNDTNGDYFVPDVNPEALMPSNITRNDHNWMSWVNATSGNKKATGIKYKNSYIWKILYARILPSDFELNVANPNHVQIWKFVLLNGVPIFAERQTNAHNLLPIIVCKPSADGLGWQAKGFAENATPAQTVATGLMSSAIESQRRKVYDRIFYDSKRVEKKDIDVVSSVARIPVKNNAYGKNIAEAIYAAPYRDDGVTEVLSMSQQIAQTGDIANGQNRVTQGQFQKGNKTRKEFDTVMGNANSRSRLRALALEFSFFVPIKEIVKSNILQFQPPVSMLNTNTGQTAQIDPEALRKASVSFTLSDGYMPSEKLLSSDNLGMLFQAAPAMPQIAVEYDLMGMFMYSMQLQGGGWMRQFKRTPEEQQAQLAQMQQATQAAGTTGSPPAAGSQGASQ